MKTYIVLLASFLCLTSTVYAQFTCEGCDVYDDAVEQAQRELDADQCVPGTLHFVAVKNQAASADHQEVVRYADERIELGTRLVTSEAGTLFQGALKEIGIDDDNQTAGMDVAGFGCGPNPEGTKMICGAHIGGRLVTCEADLFGNEGCSSMPNN